MASQQRPQSREIMQEGPSPCLCPGGPEGGGGSGVFNQLLSPSLGTTWLTSCSSLNFLSSGSRGPVWVDLVGAGLKKPLPVRHRKC